MYKPVLSLFSTDKSQYSLKKLPIGVAGVFAVVGTFISPHIPHKLIQLATKQSDISSVV